MIKKSIYLKFIVYIIIGLFIAEVISMGIISFFLELPFFQLTLIDAFLLILFATPLLYYFSLTPLLNMIDQRQSEIDWRRQTEMQLRIQTTALETAANGIMITNKQGSIIWANQAFAKMSGYPVEEALGKTPSLLSSGSHSAEFYKNLWVTILSGHVWHGEFVNRRKNGELYVEEQTISPVLNSSGEIENFIAIQQDVTERREAEVALLKSEEKFRALLDWTYDWEIWEDAQDKIMYNSPSCERITGYHPNEFVRNPELLKSIVHPQDQEIFGEHTTLHHNDNKGVVQLEYRIIALDGSERWINHNCRPLFGAGGEYMGRRVSNRDITEWKRSEENARERSEKEKMLTQTIHTMQLNIARDLHDTVGQNISFLRLKLDHLSGLDFRMDVDVRSEIANMARVANESYDLVRGTLAVLQSESVDDLFLVFIRYARQIEERSKIKIDFANDGETRLLTANQMRQLFFIFREALSNIEKHSDANRVFIKTNWAEKELTLIILDNGCGLDDVDKRQDNHYGLKFMRERVDLLNGTMAIDSEVGAGTNITISIPYE